MPKTTPNLTGDMVKSAGGRDKAVVARDIIEKLYYNGQPEEAEVQAALVLCILKLDEVINDE